MTLERDSSATGSPRHWRAGSREIALDRPLVVGILNVTPDSFTDGGNFFSPETALEQAAKMIAEGVDVIDVGGESTRPGAQPVSSDEEVRRVLPIVRAISERWPDIPISIDTTKAAVAMEALDAGAAIVNDVSALRLDPDMAPLAGKARCGIVLMHSRGDVASMASYENAIYADVPSEVLSELGSQILLAEEAGVDRKSIVLDPGFGFSKRTEQSYELLQELVRFTSYDVPIMVGFSRKRMLSAATGSSMTLEEKDAATSSFNVMALERGAMLFRVHDVGAARRALDEAWAALNRQRIA